ncbi:MAG TPA: transglycosylase domain-containing protein [Patescibacteria group bacterium]|nr:transglycosylase domain-containing protein [Patescibacteria group bacterium]
MSKRRKNQQRLKVNLSRVFQILQRLSLRAKVGIAVGAFLFLILLPIILFFHDLPSPKRLNDAQNFPISTKILDRNGKLLYEVYADKNRTPIKLADLPPYVYQASIAIEDQNFYHHFGFDITGIIRALKNTIFQQRLQGGSTITQQLVKTALLTPKRTVSRKIKEAVLTLMTEALYSKNQILEMYLNNIPYGGTSWGIEAAAHTYFDTDAKNLTIAQAALIAGLPASPTTYSPFTRPDLAKQRQVEVLKRMLAEKYITPDQEKTAESESLTFATSKIDIKAPHFVFYIKDLLSQQYSDYDIARSGLRVTTTLDLDIQNKAQASLSAEINKLKNYRVGNGAAVITNPKTGEILAMIGSRDYFDATHDGQFNVTTGFRQPGSSIKPLNYVTAFESQKLTPGSMLLDIPTCFQVAGQPNYCPKNYDGTFRGPVQVRFALGNSLNIPAVKTLAINGVNSFINSATAMGITTWTDPTRYGLSLTLGGGEVTMLDMATAYGTIANEGVRVNLHPILKIEDYTGKVLEQYDPQNTVKAVDDLTEQNASPSGTLDTNALANRVLHRATTYLISHILLDNNAREGAFGPSSQLIIPGHTVSVKTGTTNDLRDNWTIGYTPNLLTAVWVGNNDNTPMNRALVSGITGAAPIWNDIMRSLLKGVKDVWPDKPDDVQSAIICATSGLVPDPNSPCPTRTEYFWQGTQPNQLDASYRDIWIVPTTGLPPKAGDSTDGLQTQHHEMLSDPFTKDYCVDCTRPVDDKGHTVFEQYFVPYSSGTFSP